MRKLTMDEIETVGGAIGPWGAAAGSVAGGLAYVGTKAGSGEQATLGGAASAMVGGAVTGWFSPTTTAQSFGLAIASVYAGLAGGYMDRALNGA